eukprot:488023-Prymnesium_polylepis.1
MGWACASAAARRRRRRTHLRGCAPTSWHQPDVCRLSVDATRVPRSQGFAPHPARAVPRTPHPITIMHTPPPGPTAAAPTG